MIPFLEGFASQLIERHQYDFERVCVVLPSRRGSVFLRKHLGEQISKPVFSPKIFAIEDFVASYSRYAVADSLTLLCEFYSCYKTIPEITHESFESVVKWGQQLLHDFNEVDHYMIDHKDLFSFIDKARAIEVWNPDGSEPSEYQEKYLEFWKSLGIFYTKFKSWLQEKEMSYQGMAFRDLAENIEDKIDNGAFEPWDAIYFVGFNALNNAELAIIKSLKKTGKLQLIWDVDKYYFADKHQEAGLFLRRHAKLFGNSNFQDIGDSLLKDAKQISIVGAPGNIAQAKYAGQLLEENTTDLTKTAVVLADEELLMPFLHSLPENIDKLNITMGFPLKFGPFHSFWNLLFGLYGNQSKFGNRGFYHKDVISILRHPAVASQHTQKIIDKIIQLNLVFITNHFIQQEANALSESAQAIWCLDNNTPQDFLTGAIALIEAFENENDQADTNALYLEYWAHYKRVFIQLQELNKRYAIIETIPVLKVLFSQLVSGITIDFFGEPLAGLQVMGMLETRTLDFEKIILISANEDVLPAGRSQNSFIPYDVKRNFGLPTHHEKDAIFAYHFYRLIQKAEDIHIMYNTSSDSYGSAEKSRFLTQLQYELNERNPKSIIESKIIQFPIDIEEDDTICVAANEYYQSELDSLAAYGFSPSSLNTYINCPLDFYFQYILRFTERNEVEETVEASTLGSIIHQVLEDFYKPLKGHVLKVDDLKKMIKKVATKTKSEFERADERKPAIDTSQGKNLITFEIAVAFITTFLNNEIKLVNNLKKNNEYLTIMALEQKLEFSKTIKGKQINFRGTIDRIDRIGTQLRIIDYKTGDVNSSDLKFKDFDTITTDPKYSKVFQLLMYGLLYKKANQSNFVSVQSGIISMRRLSEGFMPIEFQKNTCIDDSMLDEFEVILDELIMRIIDDTQVFSHREKSKYCDFCHI